MRPTDRSYLKSHEWCKIEDGVATIGITDFAVSHLSDLVFLDLPKKGASVTVGESFGEIESVKAVSSLYSPVGGEVIEGNPAVADDPALINRDPEGEGWFFKLKLSDPAELDGLMDEAAYREWVKTL